MRAARGPRRGGAALAAMVLCAVSACTSTSADPRTVRTPEPAPVTVSFAPVTTPPRPAPSRPVGPPPASLSGLHIAALEASGGIAWTLGTVACRAAGRCAILARSVDGGRGWQPVAAPPGLHVYDGDRRTCLDPCVSGVVPAGPRVAYLYGGPAISDDGHGETLLMTTDGGRSWARQAGGADALAVAGGTAIRVVSDARCTSGCTITLQEGRVGGTAWHEVTLPGAQNGGARVSIVRAGRAAYVMQFGRSPGGGPGPAVLWGSSDGGARWVDHGEPCPQLGGAVDSAALAIAPDGAVVVVCAPRDGAAPAFTLVSTDGMRTAHRQGTLRPGARIELLAAGSADLQLVGLPAPYFSADGGAVWRRLPGPARVGLAGFASTRSGWLVEPGRAHSPDTVWISSTAGRTWTRVTL